MTIEGQLSLVHVAVAPPANNGSESPDFVEFYERAYPRKQARGAARAAWNRAIRKATPQVIIFAARLFAEDPNRDPSYTPHPATWLNQERWSDEHLPKPKVPTVAYHQPFCTECREAHPPGEHTGGVSA